MKSKKNDDVCTCNKNRRRKAEKMEGIAGRRGCGLLGKWGWKIKESRVRVCVWCAVLRVALYNQLDRGRAAGGHRLCVDGTVVERSRQLYLELCMYIIYIDPSKRATVYSIYSIDILHADQEKAYIYCHAKPKPI